ncbi:MAG: phytoene desaturase [Saprospiraceae bacterium]|nr:phytoene desaturase [Saprospiraceae bacterium]
MKQTVSVLGAGFSGLAAAASLAREGLDVQVIERHDQAGGRARQFTHDGFVFDMGPSWYWMPDVFEAYFQNFGKTTSELYDLKRLDPSYQVFFKDGDVVQVPASGEAQRELFEKLEPGSGPALDRFLADSRYKYETGMQEFVYKPSHSVFEFADLRILRAMFRLQMFSSLSKEVRRLFKHPKLIQILEFPVLFLGAKPEKTPALYSMMNHADLTLGTWYPMGGMHQIVKSMEDIAREQGVRFQLNEDVQGFAFEGNRIAGVKTNATVYTTDAVVNTMDYHHLDQQLLPKPFQEYSADYWDKRVMAPSSLLYYIGVDKKLTGLTHHNLFFDADFGAHAAEIYDHPAWPEDPLFYVCCPSVTDSSVAPAGMENLFILIPVAPGLEDHQVIHDAYYDLVMDRLEKRTGQDIRKHVIYKRSYAHRDFQKDYHAFKGNAYGLANTLFQTAFLKPKMKSRKVENLWHAGQLTVPGPGVPPSLISGQVAAQEVIRDQKRKA